jgi:prepilin-type N-terminal cleavage/methylation domain-containing protein
VTSRRSLGFTLIEIMIVVGIMGIVMTMSLPLVYKVWRKAPMRQAVKDIVEACSHARARAIMQGTVTEVVFHPKENRLEVVGAGSLPPPAAERAGAAVLSASAASGSGLSAQLSDQVIIETLDVNMSGVEFNDAEQVRIRFYPNGICDEMRMILFDGRNRMGIELEITTGLANVVPDPLREWTRR